MKKRDYRAEYRRKKELRKQAQEEATKHFRVASKALKAVLTGHRMSHDKWIEDVERANRCITMAFIKDDEVFRLSKALVRKYSYVKSQTTGD